jgi:dienelactone hydrolase
VRCFAPTFWVALGAAPLLFSCTPAAPSRLEGSWTGTVADGQGATGLVLDFAAHGGRWTGTMSLPGRRLLGKTLPDIRFAPPDLSFTLPAHAALLCFQGRLSPGTIDGTIRVEGRTIPLHLQRSERAAPPYREDQVSFGSGDTTLHGALLRPAGAGPFPAVILIHGSSTPDRNDFRYFADLFARHGIAALIYDKRDTGGEANGGTASLETLAGDVLAAAATLDRRRDIARGRIGLWGFSQGGWVAPIAASRRRFAFIIACSTAGVSYADVNRFQDAARLRANGFSSADVEAAMQAERRLDQFVRDGRDPTDVQAMLDGAAGRPWARFITLPRRLPSAAEKGTYLRWRDLDLDPSIYWRQVDAPVFVALGTADLNVPPKESAGRIAAALSAGGNRNVTVRFYEGANHELFPAPSLEADTIGWVQGVLGRRP